LHASCSESRRIRTHRDFKQEQHQFALARANANYGEVSSGELEMKDGRLVCEVRVLNPTKRATSVWIDANSGEVLEATQHGGLKATLVHHKENKKLLNAKRDSAAKNP
jgi:hypothetical protein